MSAMRNDAATVDALGSWFASQGIGPAKAVPIMAKAMVVAVISACRHTDNLQDTTDGVMAASKLVLEAYRDMLEVNGKMGKRK